MNTRQILENLGLSKQDVIDLVVQLTPDFTLDELEFIQMQVDMEFIYREDHNMLGDDEDDQ
jgi:hypothetical protein